MNKMVRSILHLSKEPKNSGIVFDNGTYYIKEDTKNGSIVIHTGKQSVV